MIGQRHIDYGIEDDTCLNIGTVYRVMDEKHKKHDLKGFLPVQFMKGLLDSLSRSQVMKKYVLIFILKKIKS